MFVTFLALFTLYKREHVTWLVLIIVVSIGFYGVKGGVFTLSARRRRIWSGGHPRASSPITTHLHSPSS